MVDKLLWAALAGIHAMPALAFFRPGLLARLYGIGLDSPLLLIVRHRAALFLIIVVVALWAMVDPAVRPLASVAVALSMTSFLLLYQQSGRPRGLRTIALVDLAGLPIVALAMWRAFAH